MRRYCPRHLPNQTGYDMTGYRKEFDLNPSELGMIEESLRGRLGELCREHMAEDAWPADSSREVRDIRQLLGKLHSQKIWFQPEGNAPRG